MKKLFDLLLQALSVISRKKVLYISNKDIHPSSLAVKSAYDFWYTGNVYDQSDIAYGIAQHGTVERFDTEVVVRILKTLDPRFTFFDIGANTGWYSMLAAATSSLSTVHSFEPLKEHTECLIESAKINSYEKRVHVHELALSNTSGSAEILLAGSGSSLNGKFLEHQAASRTVPLKTLDEYISVHHLPCPDFIKIDVEGHEYEVLQGASVTIEHHPIFFIEIAYTLKNIGRKFTNTHFDDTLDMLQKAGYRAYILSGDTVEHYRKEKVRDGVHMYLFLHPRHHPGALEAITI